MTKLAATVLVICVAALLALSLVMLYSAQMSSGSVRYLAMQLGWSSIGVLACVCMAWFDYRQFKKVAWPLFALAVFLLLLVFLPVIGIRKHGASRWVGWHGSILFQPSECAKLALILTLAWYGERFQRQMGTWKRGVLIPGVFVGLLLGLIFIEPDRGTTILLAGVSGAVLLIAGVRWRYLLPPVFLAVAGLAFSIWRDPMRSGRVMAWLHPEQNTKVAYQAYHAMLALGSGGWTGLGLGNGRQKLGFVPENHTDFILSVIGEELGLIATLLVVLAFVVIFVCGIVISTRSSDTFGFLLGCGLSFLIGLQALINIGVVTSALPNKGLALPFISYGGSSVVIMLTAVGLLLSIAHRANATPALPGSSSGVRNLGEGKTT
jgi:cell division protein FtsW